MQIETKTSYTISLNQKEMVMLKDIIELALSPSESDITDEMEEVALEILEYIRE